MFVNVGARYGPGKVCLGSRGLAMFRDASAVDAVAMGHQFRLNRSCRRSRNVGKAEATTSYTTERWSEKDS